MPHFINSGIEKHFATGSKFRNFINIKFKSSFCGILFSIFCKFKIIRLYKTQVTYQVSF